MRILKLEGELIGQHRKLGPIFFPEEGLFGILGPNGAGKSTIFSAINIALFGTPGDVKMAEIKNHDAKKSQKWWVELVFEIGDIQYAVYRHETTAKSFLKANGKTIQLGQTDVTEHIVSSVLQMDQTAFLNAFYGKQDEFDNLNKLTNEKRKKEISKLLKINNIDKGIDSLRTDKNVLNTQITEQSRHILDEKLLTAEKEHLNNELKTSNEIMKEKQKNLNTKETEFNQLKNELSANEKKSELHTELINQHLQVSNTIKNIQNSMIPRVDKQLNELRAKIDSVHQLDKELLNLPKFEIKEKELEQLKTNFEQRNILSTQLQQNKSNLTAKKTIIDKATDIITENESVLVSFNKTSFVSKVDELSALILKEEENLQSLNGDLSVIVSKGKETKSEIEKLRSLGANSTCPTCKQILGEQLESIIRQLEERSQELGISYKEKNATLTLLQSNTQKHKTEYTKLQNELLSMDKKENDLNNARMDIEIKRAEFKELKEQYFTLESEIKKLSIVSFNPEELQNVRSSLRDLYQIQERVRSIRNSEENVPLLEKERKELADESHKLSQQLSEIQENGKQLGFDKNQFVALKEKYNNVFSEIRQIEKEVSIISNQATSTLKELESLEQKSKRNNEEQLTLFARKKEFSILLYLEEVFKNYKVDQLSKLAPAISTIMQNLLAQLTDGKYDLVELDEHYNVFVYRNQIRQPLHLFSGGERKLISLVQRLAISHIIVSKTSKKKFEFLALDEVLGSMDEERQESILEGLRRLNGIFKQILMVSHNSNIHDMFDYTLRVEQDEQLNTIIRWDEDWDQESIKNQIIL